MNFLLRATQPMTTELPSVPENEPQKDDSPLSKRATTLGHLIAEDPYPNPSTSDDGDRENNEASDANGVPVNPTLKDQTCNVNHTNVPEEEGWITIPCKELPDGWSDAPNMHELRSLDRSFVFPGEQLHILVCLSASKQDSEIITPFRVAAVMSKNGSGKKDKRKMEIVGNKSNSVNGEGETNGIHGETIVQVIDEKGVTVPITVDSPRPDISATESFLRMEDHKQQTETLLERFRNSNFFVRIAGSDEPLWSKRNNIESFSISSQMPSDGGSRKISSCNLQNVVIDRGSFDGITSGVARDTVRCYSLSNGDLVVRLQINVGVTNVKDPVLEVLQFEKYHYSGSASAGLDNSFDSNQADPCHELLSWLLPVDRSLPPPRPLSPPLGSTPSLGATHQRSSSSGGSQLFSFSHFRSYSMPSLPQVAGPPPTDNPTINKPAFDLEELDCLSSEKLIKSQDSGNEGLLSFRGVSLEPERFSVHCGLEGIYLPGRRWRRKLEIVQPIEIHSFAAGCVTENLLCVQVKNISPPHLPDLIIFLDAITIVFEEASKSGMPLSLPIASIETGDAHSLPNIALRRGEEHSFVLRPATIIARDLKVHSDSSSQSSHLKIAGAGSSMHQTSRTSEGTQASSSGDQFAVMLSCRCNYTESKLFFKQPTSWQPRIARDLMISVSSETTEQTHGPIGRLPQLPVQVLTLQASNFTPEDRTITVNAPISSTCPLPATTLNSASTTQLFGLPELTMGKASGEKRGAATRQLSSMPTIVNHQNDSAGGGIRSFSLGQHTGTISDVIPSGDLHCTHLWLQSKVPLGCIPPHSSATVKLELLPLTDGIITLDTLQVAVKEKGLTYVPEQPLKIHVTSGIATGFP